MFRLIFLFFTLLTCFFNIVAQTTATLSISGKLLDQHSREPLEFVSVVLYSLPDTTMVSGTLSNRDGRFSFTNVKPGNYLLKCTSVGYKGNFSNIELDDKSFTFSTPLLLTPLAHALNEVTVTGSQAEKKFSIEKTRIQASGNLGASTGSILEILRSASSVNIDNNDKISIRGNDNVLILLDGIPTTLDNLNHLAAGNVQSIEVITSPDVTQDSEGTGGIVNIVSKRNAMAGLHGMVSASYGFMNKLNGTAAFSYNVEKWMIGVSYSGKYERDIIDSDLYRYFYLKQNSISQDIHATRRTANNILGANVSYRPNVRDSYSLGLKLLLPRINNFQNFNNRYVTGNEETFLYRQNDINFNREVVEGSFTYNRIIDPRKRELSILASISAIHGHRPSFYYENHELCQKSISGGRPFLSSLQTDYKTQAWGGKLETGLKMTYRQNNIHHSFYDYDGESRQWVISTFFSNDLRHREYIPAAYGMYSVKPADRLSLKLGLRAEYSIVTLFSNHESIDTRSHNLFISPQLTGEYTFSSHHSVAGGFTRRITRPTYPQLNPYTNVIDNTTFETGNIHLSPETINKVDVGYSYTGDKISLNANCYFNFANKFITQIADIKNNSLILTFVNGSWDKKTGMDLSINFKPIKWLNISLNANTYYSHSSASSEGVSMINYGWSNSSNALLNLKLKKGTVLTAQYFFIAPQYFPQFTVKRIHYLNIGLKQSLIKDQLNLTATLTDVFNSRRWDVTSDNNLYKLINNSKSNTCMLWLGISYNFNAYKQEPNKKAGNEEDINLIRLGQ